MLQAPRTVLVLKPSSFGDVVHTLPAVARLKAAWPHARISWLINPEWQPLLINNPDVEDTLIFPRGEFRGWRGLLRFKTWCRRVLLPLQPDLALDFQGLLRSAWMGRASRAGVMFGLADAREGAAWFYDRTAAVPAGVPHAVERYVALADAALSAARPSNAAASEQTLSFPLPPGQPLERGPARISENFILLHPFARGEAKSLSLAQVAEFCRWLAPRQIVVVGRSNGRATELPAGAVNLLDQTSLPQLIWLIRRAAFVVSVDSGPAHLAAALGKPMIAIHTWSDPRRVGPFHPTAWIWKNRKLFQRVEMLTMDAEFFRRPALEVTSEDVAKISALVISSSGFCA